MSNANYNYYNNINGNRQKYILQIPASYAGGFSVVKYLYAVSKYNSKMNNIVSGRKYLLSLNGITYVLYIKIITKTLFYLQIKYIM